MYWLEGNKFERVRSGLAGQGITLQQSKKAVCVPLSRRIQAGFVPPGAWDEYALCRRQLSWYRVSPYRGMTLVISSGPIQADEVAPETVIRERRFRPKSLPGRDQQLAMIARESYRRARPDAWEELVPEDKELRDRWLKIMGVRGISYEELFITHCANHANFIDPTYFIREEDGPVPYSIARTTHICSACLEFFNIVGSRFRKKLVVPCPGAVLFAGMAPNRYYEVLRP